MPSNPHDLDSAPSRGPAALFLVVDSVGSYFCNQKPSSLTHIVGRLTLVLVVGRPFRNVKYTFTPRPTTFMVVDSHGKQLFYHILHTNSGHSTPPHHTAGGPPAPTALANARLPLAFPPSLRTPHRLHVLGSLVPPSLTGGRATPHRGPSLGLSPQRPANRAVTSLRLLPGLRPPAPRVQRHVRCPSELCLPTPFQPHPSPSRGTVRTPVALTASPAPDRGPHQPLAAHSRSEGRQPGALAGPIRWAPTNPQHPTLPRSTTLEAPPSHRHGPNSSRGPSLLCPGADLPAMRGAVQLGSVRLPITRRHHIGVTSQVSPPPVLLAARPSPGGQQYLDLL